MAPFYLIPINMGHYSDCYEQDEIDRIKRRHVEVDNELKIFIKDASLIDKEFILDIIKDIEGYKGFFRVLRKEK